jgi:C-terminal processing protease CtpA/Prc
MDGTVPFTALHLTLVEGRRMQRASRNSVTVSGSHEALRALGVRLVAHLAGGIGYVEVSELRDPSRTDAAISEALARVGDAPALILDLRGARAGDPATVAMLSSYLFDTEPVHLEEVYRAAGDALPPRPAVAVRRYLDRDVYVLTSAHTAPAAAELARRLQRMGRALVVGEAPLALGGQQRLMPDLACDAGAGLQVAHATAARRLLAVGAAPDRRKLLRYVEAVGERVGRALSMAS